MRAVFHIGRPKCGTTSIQVFLQENRDRLSQQGVVYQRSDDNISSQWEFPIAALSRTKQFLPDPFVARMLNLDTLDDQNAYADAKLKMLDQLVRSYEKSHHTWVGSSEHATPYLRRPERVSALDSVLKERFEDVQYVLHVRRQEDMLASAYAEGVRRGETIGLSEYVKHTLEKDLSNHMWLTRIWTEVIDKNRITVRLLESDALFRGDLCRDFARILNVDDSQFRFPRQENPAPAARTLPFLLFLNRFVADDRQRATFRRQLREFCARQIDRMLGDGPKMELAPETIEHIRKRSAVSNEKLRRAFFPDRPELFPERKPRKSQRNKSQLSFATL